MSVPIKIKRNTTAGTAPTTLAVGELAADTVNNKLYLGGNSGVVTLINSGGAATTYLGILGGNAPGTVFPDTSDVLGGSAP